MNDEDDMIADAVLARTMRESAQHEQTEIRELRDAVALPLWERIKRRRLVNGFGEDFDLSLTPRKAG